MLDSNPLRDLYLMLNKGRVNILLFWGVIFALPSLLPAQESSTFHKSIGVSLGINTMIPKTNRYQDVNSGQQSWNYEITPMGGIGSHIEFERVFKLLKIENSRFLINYGIDYNYTSSRIEWSGEERSVYINGTSYFQGSGIKVFQKHYFGGNTGISQIISFSKIDILHGFNVSADFLFFERNRKKYEGRVSPVGGETEEITRQISYSEWHIPFARFVSDSKSYSTFNQIGFRLMLNYEIRALFHLSENFTLGPKIQTQLFHINNYFPKLGKLREPQKYYQTFSFNISLIKKFKKDE